MYTFLLLWLIGSCITSLLALSGVYRARQELVSDFELHLVVVFVVLLFLWPLVWVGRS